jgi:hypothetical protein
MQKSRANLQNQLESYSLASKGLRAPKNWKSGGSVLATVAGSALALATNANASIIYSGVQNITASKPAGAAVGTVGAGFTVGGAPWAVQAFNNLSGRNSTASAKLHWTPGAGQKFMASNSFSNRVKALASGAVISGGQPFDLFTHGILRLKNHASYPGLFLNSVNAFAGIRFTQAGNTHFGWIRLHVTTGPSDAVTATAIDWAYNDVAGASILAGEGVTAATPEPSTVSMALLAAGAAGVLSWRKRRKQIAA